jgi:hypothetical protein
MAVPEYKESLGRRACAWIGQRGSGIANPFYETWFQYGFWWNHCHVSCMDRDGNFHWLACVVKTTAGIKSSQRNSSRLVVRFEAKGMHTASLFLLLSETEQMFLFSKW